jgi:hypothetical protein
MGSTLLLSLKAVQKTTIYFGNPGPTARAPVALIIKLSTSVTLFGTIGPIARAALCRSNFPASSFASLAPFTRHLISRPSLQPLLALDLVRRLCKRLPNERLSAFQALNHPWLRSDACDFFRPQPQRTILCTYKPPPSCRYASRPGQSSALCSCPMLKKFGFCAFAHPPEDLKTNARSSADAVESSPAGPELWMAQLSSVSSMLQLQPAEGQHVRLLRHNCEGEIGWSCVQIHDTENGLCEEGLIASCCIGLPPSAADDWRPPTYDVDTHKFPSVFKQARVHLKPTSSLKS